jgi:hypothetical protein
MKNSLVFAVSLLATAFCDAALGAPVHISVETLMGSQEHGAGISVGKGLECYVVAPRHVVEMAQTITVKDLRGNTSIAEPFQDAPAEIDAILLKVEQDHRLDCPEDWDDGSDAESILYDVEFVISRKVKGGGVDSRRFFPGSVTSTTIELQPFSNGNANRLVEGDSGSALYAKNLPLGMIVEVDTKTGEAEAVKQSQLHALFGQYVLERKTKVVLINPVYKGYQENRYASAAVKEFVQTRTPLGVQEISPAIAQANLRSEQRGVAVEYPDTVDYVILSSILSDTTRRETNPNYNAKKSKSKSFSDKLVSSMKGQDYQYFLVSNVDVEVTLIIPATNQRATHIERLEYRTALKDGVNQQEVTKSAPIQGSVQAVYAAFNKFGLPVIEQAAQSSEPRKKKKNKKKKKKKKKKLEEEAAAAALGLSADD